MAEIKPMGARLLLEVLPEEQYVKTSSGLILENEKDDTETHAVIRAKITEVGDKCELFKSENIGLVVILHKYGGTKIKSIKENDLRIVSEHDIFGFEKP